MKNNQKGFIGVAVAVIIALILGGGGVYYYNKNKEVKEEVKTEETVFQGNSETSDWKTYRDEEYGFEFQYPKSYGEVFTTPTSIAIGKFDENGNGGGAFAISLPKVFLTNGTSGQPRTIDDMLSCKDYGSKECKRMNFSVGGIQSVGVSYSQDGDFVYVPLKDNEIMVIHGNFNDPLFIQLVSTFKFTN